MAKSYQLLRVYSRFHPVILFLSLLSSAHLLHSLSSALAPVNYMAAAAAVISLLNLPPTSRSTPSKSTKPAPFLLSPPALSLKITLPSSASFAGITSLPLLLAPQDAFAVDGEFGILEGRTIALVHPLVMGGLFFYTLWAGYLGWQWRRVRTIQDEINELKKQVKSPAPAAVAGGDGGQEKLPPLTHVPSPVEAKIQQLTEERKELVKGSFRDRHYNAGSILLSFGVLAAVGGAVNTWLRTGKLFPGPHLFAGAGITVLWALAAALVPQMQKGNETARNLHIALNSLNVLLFLWQIPTGLDIVLKVFEFTNWP